MHVSAGTDFDRCPAHVAPCASAGHLTPFPCCGSWRDAVNACIKAGADFLAMAVWVALQEGFCDFHTSFYEKRVDGLEPVRNNRVGEPGYDGAEQGGWSWRPGRPPP